MTQAFWALANRSLRLDNRSLHVHLLRLSIVLFTYIMLIAAHAMSSMADTPGLQLFTTISYLNIGFILAAAGGLFCSAITQEKEELTLGLLKMAGVSSAALLLGKFLPRIFTVVILLLAQLPFVVLAVTLGGVSVQQIAAAYLCLFCFLLLAAGLGMFCSVICKSSRSAGLVAFLIGLSVYAGPVLINGMIGMCAEMGLVAHNGWVATAGRDLLILLSTMEPLGRLARITATGGDTSLWHGQTISNGLAGLLLVLLSWIVFERFTREDDTSPRAARKADRKQATQSIAVRRRWSACGRTWTQAIIWKDYHFIAGGDGVFWGLLALMLTGTFFLVLITPANSLAAWVGILVGVSAVVGVLQASFLAGRIFSEEVHHRTLTSLAMLPISIPELMWEKTKACAIALAPATALCVLGFSVLSLTMLADTDFGEGSFISILMATLWLSKLALFLYFAAWLSLYVKWGAVPLAFVAFQIGNTLLQALISIPLALVGSGYYMGMGPTVYFFATACVSLPLCVAFMTFIHRRIVRRLAELAAQ